MTTQHPEAEWLDEIFAELADTWMNNLKLPLKEKTPNPSRKAKSQILSKLKSAEIEGRIDELNFILDNASGGGTWRRVIISQITVLRAQLKTIKEAAE